MEGKVCWRTESGRYMIEKADKPAQDATEKGGFLAGNRGFCWP
jgi:hypothetical protein